MRRSILIVMLDVMVLSVLALTAGQRSGGERNIPVPLYRWSSMIEEGLRKEQAFRDEVLRLEEQLAQAAELAKKALDQADEARDTAGREREGSKEMQARVHAMELAAEKARAAAELAKREALLARQTAADARLQAEESERRRAEAEQGAEQARLTAAESFEQTAAAKLAAEKAAKEAALARSEGERLKIVAQTADTARLQALQEVEAARQQALQEAAAANTQIVQLQTRLAEREGEMTELQVSEAVARERAEVITQERERLVAQREQASEQVVELSGQVAELEVRKETAEMTVAMLEDEQKQAAEELKKSVWVRREESLRSLNISFTEYNSRDDRSFVTHRELVMPLVLVGRAVLVPADFRKLGLGRSFFGGLSDSVTHVEGTVSPVTEQAAPLPLQSIVVPGPEPQVCFVRFAGSSDGALNSISMEALKEQRLKNALLFSPGKVNDHGRVEISPLIGSDYLSVRRASGKKPKVGDYLLTDRGEFIGVMVTGDECYVTPEALSREPAPVIIPIASRQRDGIYFQAFIDSLTRARDRVDEHLKSRRF